MKLQLPDVTLVAVDTKCHELTAIAIEQCLAACDFGGVQVHSDRLWTGCQLPDWFWYGVPPFRSIDEVMAYLWKMVPATIETEMVLFVQWDSGIIDPGAWSNDWLQYDWIGAPWGWFPDDHNVGNGGFSLRSRRLMRHLAKYIEPKPLIPEDAQICREHRQALEHYGFRWAPLDVASRFSVERTAFPGVERHFGYHGIFNWPRVLKPDDMRRRMQLVDKNPYLQGKIEVREVREHA